LKALITGVAGFGGRHLKHHLQTQGDEVVGFARAPNEGDASVYRWDLRNALPTEFEDSLPFDPPEAIYHLAAMSVPSDCGLTQPTDDAWEVNVVGVERIIDFARRYAPNARLVFVSSCYVYSSVVASTAVVSETSPTEPSSAYGKTKLAAENKVVEAAQRGEIDAVIARVFHHTGPGQSSRMMAPEWACKLSELERSNSSEPSIQVRNLSAYLDLSDVRDIVRAYRLLATHGKTGSAYNIGSGIDRSSGEILQSLCELAQLSPEVIETAPQMGQHPIADTTAIRTDTGWSPSIPLEATLVDTLDYWRAQQLG